MVSLPGPAWLFCPGNRPDRFAKAAAAADAVILDLEDAVAPEDKDTARGAVLDALAGLDPAAVLVRVNAADTEWHAADVAALSAHPDLVLMLPKAERPEDVAALAPHPVVALCETARGVLAAPEIAGAANCAGLMWGSEDLMADLGARWRRNLDGGYQPVLEEARVRILYAARAAGISPVDTVLIDIEDERTLEADSIAASGAGFFAKACIHPRQVDVVRAAFCPNAEEVEWARAVLAAAEGNDAVFRFRGRMVDAPVLAHAREILRRA
ncbi:citrate lyase subunit beta / citryl-CoA lyase [Pseudonocardia thermophila]|uniref:Citrate lyase subunit beta / citryl-CoA lyase n=1 Tax=Pseudonocardia thermophila TaxID=1848 RepID=A0A1M6SKP0_PSETH|nr:citrate lyase subunit beta / citryl-CoA lyase [Pseudonocardia thermophila]